MSGTELGRGSALAPRLAWGACVAWALSCASAQAATGDQCLQINPLHADLNCNGLLLVDEGACLTWDVAAGYCSAEDAGYCDELSDLTPLDGLPAACDDLAGLAVDADDDCIGDLCDNCVGLANGDQADADLDGVGDACDACPGSDDHVDTDQDGVPDACDQCALGDDGADADGDGVADACDPCPNDNPDDPDSDGHCGADTDVPVDTDLPSDTDTAMDTDDTDVAADTDDTDVAADTDAADTDLADTGDTDLGDDSAVETDADTDTVDRGVSYLDGGFAWSGCSTAPGAAPIPWLGLLVVLARRRATGGGGR